MLIAGASGYNRLNVLSNAVDGKWANVQSSYQRRNDLIPNLVDTVKASANFEKSTLTDVINARAKATSVTIDPSHAPTDPAQLDAYQKAQGQLGSSLSRLLVTVEKYPELSSTQRFPRSPVADRGHGKPHQRRPQPVQRLDPGLRHAAQFAFPTVLYANLVGMKEKPFFKADESASERAPDRLRHL